MIALFIFDKRDSEGGEVGNIFMLRYIRMRLYNLIAENLTPVTSEMSLEFVLPWI